MSEKPMAVLTIEQALNRAVEHLADTGASHVRLEHVHDGWPEGAYRISDDPVWAIKIPDMKPRVGGSHYICISKATGAVVFDGYVGE